MKSKDVLERRDRGVTQEPLDAGEELIIDFAGMYATHDAFRWDLDRLVAAADAGAGSARQIRTGWENFKTQLLIHHCVEDDNLWPALRRAVEDRCRDLALVESMEVEHAELDPLLGAVDVTLADETVELGARSRDLSAALNHHLSHEEEGALPLITALSWNFLASSSSDRVLPGPPR